MKRNRLHRSVSLLLTASLLLSSCMGLTVRAEDLQDPEEQVFVDEFEEDTDDLFSEDTSEDAMALFDEDELLEEEEPAQDVLLMEEDSEEDLADEEDLFEDISPEELGDVEDLADDLETADFSIEDVEAEDLPGEDFSDDAFEEEPAAEDAGAEFDEAELDAAEAFEDEDIAGDEAESFEEEDFAEDEAETFEDEAFAEDEAAELTEIEELADEEEVLAEVEAEEIAESAEEEAVPEAASEEDVFEEAEEIEESAQEEMTVKGDPEVGILDKYLTVISGGVLLPTKNEVAVWDGMKELVFHFDLESAQKEIPGLAGFDPSVSPSYCRMLNKHTSHSPIYSVFDEDNNRTISEKNTVKLPQYISDGWTTEVIIYYNGVHYKTNPISFSWAKCGAKAFWYFDQETGCFEITGEGATNSWNEASKHPWYAIKDQIKTIKINEGITSLGQYSFNGYDALKEVTLPSSLEVLQANCFMSCHNLERVNTGKTSGLKTVQNGAFQHCFALASLDLPSVVYIGVWAFRNCKNLETLYLLSKELETLKLNEGSSFSTYPGPFDASSKLTVYVSANTAGSAFYRTQEWETQKVKGIKIHIGNATVSGSADKTYTGTPIIQTLEVKDNAYPLEEGKDYTVTYENNTAAGTASFVVKGKGDYYGSTESFTFKILPADISSATVSGLTDQTYTGTAVTPELTVKIGSSTLKKDTDYTVAYSNNTNVGTATVTITGKGNYAGTVSKTFKIKPADISSATVSGLTDQTYTGKALTPAPAVKLGTVALKKDMDYTVACKDNTNAGTATVTVTGKGNYTGTVAKTFAIKPADISSATIDGVEDQTYTGKAVTPEPTVKLGTVTLKKDTDYTVAYKDNTNVGTATVTVTGKGNYTGTVSKTFVIKEKKPAARPDDEASPDNPVPLTKVEEDISGEKTDNDIAGSSFSLLQLKATAKKSSIKLKWKPVPGATKYIIYGHRCGTKFRYKYIDTVTGTKIKIKSNHGKKLKKGKYYKYMVVAVNDADEVVASSKTVHVAMKGGKVGNTKKVKLNKSKVKLKVADKKKRKFKAVATYVNESLKVKNHRKVAWESSDVRIATVSKKGKIKAISPGTCYVYAYAQNGVMAAIKVKVK